MPQSETKHYKVYILAAAAVLAAAFVALMAGAVFIHPLTVLSRCFAAISGGLTGDATDRILFQTRLPRIILAASVGCGLSTAGLAAQTLFRNPLASPYIIGVSGGSALGAVAGMLLVSSFAFLTYAVIGIFSIAAGLLVTLAVFFLGKRAESFGNGLLLSGVAIGAFCSSLTAAALYLADERLQTIVFWMMGGFWRADWQQAMLMFPVAMGALIVMMILSPAMNVALTGERSAADLGVNIKRLQRILLIIIAVQTAVAVSLSGVIGFVGLVVPHLLRIFTGADHNRLVPATAIAGAMLMIVADTLARTLAAPAEVPVGVLTSLVGAPVFLWLLQRRSIRKVAV